MRLLEHQAKRLLASFGLSDTDTAAVAGWLEAQRTGIVGV